MQVANLVVALFVFLFYFKWVPDYYIDHPKLTALLWPYVCSPPFIMVLVLIEAFWTMRHFKGQSGISKQQIAI